ncbi:MAG: glycosyltransferase family 4 protein [Burkholderiales bacterium]|nr:glycosyltransferase family 4 protein [Burkholderiales bacterium]
MPLAAPYAYLVPLAAAMIAYALIAWMLGPHGVALPLDNPNERSLHVAPVPRTGGLALMAAALAAGAVLGASLATLGCALALAIVSFIDDRGGLPASVRFLAHGIAAAVWLAIALPGAPLWTLALLFLAIVWVTNLYNFMDGMDGLAGGMAAFGFGAYAAAFWLAGDTVNALFSASIAGAALAYLWFNFHPARIFMGDVGSIPLGFLAAVVGLEGWRDGAWPIWFPVAVFSPFIFDATVTLLRRAARGERVWEAHRTHYYQRLVQLGWGHRNTALAEYGLMVACAVVALAASRAPLAVQVAVCVGGAVVYVALALAVDGAWRRHLERARQ